LRLRNLNASLEEKLQAAEETEHTLRLELGALRPLEDKLQATEEAERTLRLELGALRRGHAAAATQVTTEIEGQRLLAAKLQGLQPDMERLEAIAAELESRIGSVAGYVSAPLTISSAEFTTGRDEFVMESLHDLVVEDGDCWQSSSTLKRDTAFGLPEEPCAVLDMAMICEPTPQVSLPELSSPAQLKACSDLDFTLGSRSTSGGLSGSGERLRLLADQEQLEDSLLNSWRAPRNRGDGGAVMANDHLSHQKTGIAEQSEPGTPTWPKHPWPSTDDSCPSPVRTPQQPPQEHVPRSMLKTSKSRVRELTPESARRPQDEPRSTLRSCPPRLLAKRLRHLRGSL